MTTEGEPIPFWKKGRRSIPPTRHPEESSWWIIDMLTGMSVDVTFGRAKAFKLCGEYTRRTGHTHKIAPITVLKEKPQ